MFRLIRIVLGILLFIFGFNMVFDETGRGINEKLTKEEKKYYGKLQIWFLFSLFSFISFLIKF